MAIYKFSNAGGFANYTRYNDFLAGNPAVILDKGSMYPLGVFTLASAQADVTFTNIPQTYTHLQIRLIGRSDRAANLDSLRVQCNADTAGNYTEHSLYGDGSTASSFAAINQNYMQFYRLAGANAGSNTFGSIYIDILDYKNTNKFKTARGLGGADNNGSGEIYFMSGLWRSTSAITSIKLYPGVGTNFVANSSFALYGVQA